MPKLQIVMLTVYKNHNQIFQALKAGACGYLLKRSSRETILGALKEVSTGGAPMTGEIARMLVEAFHALPAGSSEVETLSPRESEILRLLSEGLFNKEIADRLKISNATIRNHLHHIYEKLHVGCRTEAVLKYTQTIGMFDKTNDSLAGAKPREGAEFDWIRHSVVRGQPNYVLIVRRTFGACRCIRSSKSRHSAICEFPRGRRRRQKNCNGCGR